MHFPSLGGGLETERRRFSRSVNPLDTLRHNGSIKCKHTPMCTDTKSLFSFLRDRALAQGWPLYHNNLIHFASLCLSLYFRVGSLVHCPFVAPLNSRSQTFVSFFSPPVPQVLFCLLCIPLCGPCFIYCCTHVIECDSCIFVWQYLFHSFRADDWSQHIS